MECSTCTKMGRGLENLNNFNFKLERKGGNRKKKRLAVTPICKEMAGQEEEGEERENKRENKISSLGSLHLS